MSTHLYNFYGIRMSGSDIAFIIGIFSCLIFIIVLISMEQRKLRKKLRRMNFNQ